MISLKLKGYSREQAEKLYDIIYAGYKTELIDKVCPYVADCKTCKFYRTCKDIRNTFGYIDSYEYTES